MSAAAESYLEQALRRVGQVDGVAGVTPRHIGTAAVVGGGTMGSGIATALLMNAVPVVLVEKSEQALASASTRIRDNLDAFVSRGKLSETARDDCLERYAPVTQLEAAADADLVIEAVFEDLALKQAVFRELARVSKTDAILATNTSYLDVNVLCEDPERQSSFVGLHFFSPAQLMKLVEVIRTPRTSAQVLADSLAFADRIGKVGVAAGAGPGFIGNRILAHWRKQADYLVEDGAMPWEVDAAMEAFGFRMGPFKVMDLAGLDVSWAMRKAGAALRPAEERYVGIADELCERGWFGRKSGQGWYRYDDGKPTPNREVEPIVLAASRARGIARRRIPTAEIQQRILLSMINESANVVEDGTAARPLDVDVVKVFGYGFPRERGGPLFYADVLGLSKVKQEIDRLAAEDAYHWRLSALLERQVATGSPLSDLNIAGRE